LESSECYPPPLKPDSQANFQALNAQLGDSCSAPILEPERSALLQEALADSQLQAVKAQLERRGLGMNADEAQAVQLVGGEQLLIPFGQDAHLVWTRTNGQTAAVGLVRQGNKTLNVGADGQERVVRVLSAQQAEKLLRKLREKSKFQEFEGKLAQKGKRVGKVRVLLDETNKLAIVGIAAEGSEKIAHQVRIKVKAGKDDEPEDDAEPMIQATACGQATGEAVPTGARLQPLMLYAGEGGDVTTGSYTLIERDYGPQICTSQWGYDYLCTSTTPMLRLSLSRLAPTLALPPTFINQPVQASFTIWNGGGGTLAGTVSAQAPFSIVSGASFSLLPGQPQEVVVRFSSATAGSFSKSIAISSNGGNTTVTATGVAHKVSFSPASVDFGSGLFVLREQCDSMGSCGLRTEKVGLPIEKQLTVKNEGTVSVSLTLSTAGPYKIVSVPPTLSPGQSAQVILRFDPSRMVYVAPRVAVEEVESGEFRGSLQVGISEGQGSVTAPLVGTAHKVEIKPSNLDFGIIFVGSTRERQLTITNKGTTTVTLEAGITYPEHPLQLMLPENPFTLEPSKSVIVTARFRPVASGPISESVRLIIGPHAITVPVMGAAYTREEFEEAVYQACRAQEQQGQQIYGVSYSSMRSPSQDSHLLFSGLPCLNPEELRLVIEWIEQDQWYVPDPPVVEEQRWDKDKVIQAINSLLDAWLRAAPQDKEAVVLGLIQQMITYGHANYNRDFAEFYKRLQEGPELTRFIQRLMEWGFEQLLQQILEWARRVPGLGRYIEPIVSLWQKLFGGELPGQITAAQVFITLMIATMDAHSDIGAVATVLALIQGYSGDNLITALQTFVVTGTLVGVVPFETAGLTKSFYAGFLESLRKAPQLSGQSHIIFYMGVLTRGPNFGRADYAEHYSNLMGGFMILTKVVENGWTIKATPAAYNAIFSSSGYCGSISCPGIEQLVHVIAQKGIQGIGLVTVFVNVEAKISPDEVNRIVNNINEIIGDIVKLQNSRHTVPWHGSYPVVVQVSFNAHTSSIENIMGRLGTPGVPVVFIFVNENGLWDAKALCPASGCPGGLSPSEFARKIAEQMGITIGKKYDPETDPDILFFLAWLFAL
jgi:hypothetical protein